MMNLNIKLPHPGDEHLVERCVEFLYPESDGASVRPLGRYGYTNSRLYLVYCAPQDSGIPFVVKTDRADVIRQEAVGVRALRVFFTGANQAQVFPDFDAPEAVIYPLVSVDGAETVRELREIVYQPSRPGVEGQPNSVDGLRATYESCRRAHAVKDKRINFGAEYEWYLRESPERLLDDPLPSIFSSGNDIEVYGHRLRDPRRILNSVRAIEADTKVCPVHGDLHPNNVLFGPKFVPVLIDFAFGHRDGHFIKDFVLMECSLRFLLAPRLIRPDLMAKLDERLIEEHGYEDVGTISASGRTADVLYEMAKLVEVIRTECRRRSPEYDFQEYLIAQYLVLSGALRLLPYQDFRTLRALCHISDELVRLGVV
jgi:hypothetical protein